MAFDKNINDLKILFLVLIGVPLVASTNIDCGGKSFHCLNSTHFMICVDIGAGVSYTVDDFVIPCPSPTVCKRTNRYECEFIESTTLAPTITQPVAVTIEKETTTEEIIVDTIPWNAGPEQHLELSTIVPLDTIDSTVIPLQLVTNVTKTTTEVEVSNIVTNELINVTEVSNQTIRNIGIDSATIAGTGVFITTTTEQQQPLLNSTISGDSDVLIELSLPNNNITSISNLSNENRTHKQNDTFTTTKSVLIGTAINLGHGFDINNALVNNSDVNTNTTVQSDIPSITPVSVSSAPNLLLNITTQSSLLERAIQTTETTVILNDIKENSKNYTDTITTERNIVVTTMGVEPTSTVIEIEPANINSEYVSILATNATNPKGNSNATIVQDVSDTFLINGTESSIIVTAEITDNITSNLETEAKVLTTTIKTILVDTLEIPAISEVVENITNVKNRTSTEAIDIGSITTIYTIFSPTEDPNQYSKNGTKSSMTIQGAAIITETTNSEESKNMTVDVGKTLSTISMGIDNTEKNNFSTVVVKPSIDFQAITVNKTVSNNKDKNIKAIVSTVGSKIPEKQAFNVEEVVAETVLHRNVSNSTTSEYDRITEQQHPSLNSTISGDSDVLVELSVLNNNITSISNLSNENRTHKQNETFTTTKSVLIGTAINLGHGFDIKDALVKNSDVNTNTTVQPAIPSFTPVSISSVPNLLLNITTQSSLLERAIQTTETTIILNDIKENSKNYTDTITNEHNIVETTMGVESTSTVIEKENANINSEYATNPKGNSNTTIVQDVSDTFLINGTESRIIVTSDITDTITSNLETEATVLTTTIKTILVDTLEIPAISEVVENMTYVKNRTSTEAIDIGPISTIYTTFSTTEVPNQHSENSTQSSMTIQDAAIITETTNNKESKNTTVDVGTTLSSISMGIDNTEKSNFSTGIISRKESDNPELTPNNTTSNYLVTTVLNQHLVSELGASNYTETGSNITGDITPTIFPTNEKANQVEKTEKTTTSILNAHTKNNLSKNTALNFLIKAPSINLEIKSTTEYELTTYNAINMDSSNMHLNQSVDSAGNQETTESFRPVMSTDMHITNNLTLASNNSSNFAEAAISVVKLNEMSENTNNINKTKMDSSTTTQAALGMLVVGYDNLLHQNSTTEKQGPVTTTPTAVFADYPEMKLKNFRSTIIETTTEALLAIDDKEKKESEVYHTIDKYSGSALSLNLSASLSNKTNAIKNSFIKNIGLPKQLILSNATNPVQYAEIVSNGNISPKQNKSMNSNIIGRENKNLTNPVQKDGSLSDFKISNFTIIVKTMETGEIELQNNSIHSITAIGGDGVVTKTNVPATQTVPAQFKESVLTNDGNVTKHDGFIKLQQSTAKIVENITQTDVPVQFATSTATNKAHATQTDSLAHLEQGAGKYVITRTGILAQIEQSTNTNVGHVTQINPLSQIERSITINAKDVTKTGLPAQLKNGTTTNTVTDLLDQLEQNSVTNKTGTLALNKQRAGTKSGDIIEIRPLVQIQQSNVKHIGYATMTSPLDQFEQSTATYSADVTQVDKLPQFEQITATKVADETQTSTFSQFQQSTHPGDVTQTRTLSQLEQITDKNTRVVKNSNSRAQFEQSTAPHASEVMQTSILSQTKQNTAINNANVTRISKFDQFEQGFVTSTAAYVAQTGTLQIEQNTATNVAGVTQTNTLAQFEQSTGNKTADVTQTRTFSQFQLGTDAHAEGETHIETLAHLEQIAATNTAGITHIDPITQLERSTPTPAINVRQTRTLAQIEQNSADLTLTSTSAQFEQSTTTSAAYVTTLMDQISTLAQFEQSTTNEAVDVTQTGTVAPIEQRTAIYAAGLTQTGTLLKKQQNSVKNTAIYAADVAQTGTPAKLDENTFTNAADVTQANTLVQFEQSTATYVTETGMLAQFEESTVKNTANVTQIGTVSQFEQSTTSAGDITHTGILAQSEQGTASNVGDVTHIGMLAELEQNITTNFAGATQTDSLAQLEKTSTTIKPQRMTGSVVLSYSGEPAAKNSVSEQVGILVNSRNVITNIVTTPTELLANSEQIAVTNTILEQSDPVINLEQSISTKNEKGQAGFLASSNQSTITNASFVVDKKTASSSYSQQSVGSNFETKQTRLLGSFKESTTNSAIEQIRPPANLEQSTTVKLEKTNSVVGQTESLVNSVNSDTTNTYVERLKSFAQPVLKGHVGTQLESVQSFTTDKLPNQGMEQYGPILTQRHSNETDKVTNLSNNILHISNGTFTVSHGDHVPTKLYEVFKTTNTADERFSTKKPLALITTSVLNDKEPSTTHTQSYINYQLSTISPVSAVTVKYPANTNDSSLKMIVSDGAMQSNTNSNSGNSLATIKTILFNTTVNQESVNLTQVTSTLPSSTFDVNENVVPYHNSQSSSKINPIPGGIILKPIDLNEQNTFSTNANTESVTEILLNDNGIYNVGTAATTSNTMKTLSDVNQQALPADFVNVFTEGFKIYQDQVENTKQAFPAPKIYTTTAMKLTTSPNMEVTLRTTVKKNPNTQISQATTASTRNVDSFTATSIITAADSIYTNTTEPQFQCHNRPTGKYADDNDCSKFYICSGTTQTIVSACPSNTVFSDIRKQCTRNLSHCIRNNEFKCTLPGRFVDYLKPSVYYICIRKDQSFLRYKLQCQNGYLLNRMTVRCYNNSELITTSQYMSNEKALSTTEKIPQEKDKSITDKKKKDFECEEEGKFADPNNCKGYYICKLKNKSDETYRSRYKKCDEDEVFHREKKKCVDASSQECRYCDSLQRNIYYVRVTRGHHFLTYKLQCQNSYYLNTMRIRCEKKSEPSYSKSDSSADSSSVAEKIAREETKFNSNTSRKKFECKDEGKFADPNDCRRYYLCKVKNNSDQKYRQKHKKCGRHEVYHEGNRECVRSRSDRCL